MPILDVFFAMLFFFLWVAWIWLVISIFIDIFRSADLGGWGKAGWSVLVLLVPFLGVLIYLIVRGGRMQDRAIADAQAASEANRDYIRSVAGGSSGSVADELAKLSALRSDGAISDDEFAAAKAKLIAS
jgi:hypothetical protein